MFKPSSNSPTLTCVYIYLLRISNIFHVTFVLISYWFYNFLSHLSAKRFHNFYRDVTGIRSETTV